MLCLRILLHIPDRKTENDPAQNAEGQTKNYPRQTKRPAGDLCLGSEKLSAGEEIAVAESFLKLERILFQTAIFKIMIPADAAVFFLEPDAGPFKFIVIFGNKQKKQLCETAFLKARGVVNRFNLLQRRGRKALIYIDIQKNLNLSGIRERYGCSGDGSGDCIGDLSLIGIIGIAHISLRFGILGTIRNALWRELHRKAIIQNNFADKFQNPFVSLSNGNGFFPIPMAEYDFLIVDDVFRCGRKQRQSVDAKEEPGAVLRAYASGVFGKRRSIRRSFSVSRWHMADRRRRGVFSAPHGACRRAIFPEAPPGHPSRSHLISLLQLPDTVAGDAVRRSGTLRWKGNRCY